MPKRTPPRRTRKAARIGSRFEPLEPRRLLSVYYVSTTGNDAAAGSATAPWRTLQHAADMVIAGDVVDVRAGTYAGFTIGWNGPQNGTAASPITFSADPGVIINTRNAKTADGIDVEGASYVTIQGFTIDNSTGTITRAGIRSVTNNHVVIRDNSVNGAGDWGIFTGFSDDVLIEDNVASNSITQHGIYVSNSGDRPVIRGNIVFGNHNCGIHMNGDLSQGGDGIISDALVEDNIIYDNGVGGGSGINADGVQDSVFRNNLLYDNHASGISLFQEDGAAGSTHNIVVNNTIIMPSDARWAVNIVDGSTGNTVIDNILDNQNPGHGAINIAADSLAGFESDYNLIINNRFSPDDGGTMMTLAQWRTATGQDQHSLIGAEAATFTNPAGNDYHLAAGSPAIDAGNGAYAATVDLDGNPRPSGDAVDLGAYEYQFPRVIKAATTLGLATTADAVMQGQPATLTAHVDSGQTGAPMGTVTFFDGAIAVGAAQLDANGNAVFRSANLAPGEHQFTAIYSGDAAYDASGSEQIFEMVIVDGPAEAPAASERTASSAQSFHPAVPPAGNLVVSARQLVATGNMPAEAAPVVQVTAEKDPGGGSGAVNPPNYSYNPVPLAPPAPEVNGGIVLVGTTGVVVDRVA